MKLIVDANVLFSALIKNSLTAELLFSEELELYSVDFIIDECQKHEKTILKKTKRTKEEFIQIIHSLQEVINIIPKEEYKKCLEDAKTISPDINDVCYFALALKLKSPLWSDDKRLKSQNIVTVLSTKEVFETF